MADIHDQIEQLYPDNTEELITPSALRQGLHALARLGPNQRFDLWKSVRFMTRAEATADGNGGEVFEELDFTKCCTYSTVVVEFYRATPTSPLEYLVKLLCVYDGGPNPRYHVQRTGSFAEQVTVPAKFVRADSPEAALANIPFYKVGASYHSDDAVQYQLGGTLGVFLAKSAGQLPAPSSPTGDLYWQPVQQPGADNALSQRVSVDQLRRLSGNFKPGRLYIITGRHAADATGLADVRIRALTLSSLEPTGYLVASDDASSPTQAVRYDLATDTTSALLAAEGVAQRTGTVLAFDQEADYAELFSGTFTLDASVRKPGIVVKALLASGCTAINLPGSTFERLGFGAFTDGLAHIYLFSTSTATGKIQYTINQRY